MGQKMGQKMGEKMGESRGRECTGGDIKKGEKKVRTQAVVKGEKKETIIMYVHLHACTVGVNKPVQ